MNDSFAPLSTFHLSGERSGPDLDDIAELGLRPALLGAYGDLSRLRHDYPLVLVDGGGGSFVRALSDVIDDVLKEIAPPGIEGERLRRHVLRMEREIRTLVDGGRKGTLAQLWQRAETRLLTRTDEAARQALADSLAAARAALGLDGRLIDCNGETPVQVLTHAWTAMQADKARRLQDEISALVLRLSNILKADAMKSKEAVGAEVLKRSVGKAFETAFDFEAMSRILAMALPDGALTETRRQRIGSILSTLRSQKFFAPVGNGVKKAKVGQSYGFAFDRCMEALEAYRERLPAMVELVKAMTVARLEIENRYRDATHDPFFRRFDERFIEVDDLTLFPSYLVCLSNGVDASEETATLIEILTSNLPIKVLVQNDDILADLSPASGAGSFGLNGGRLATMATGLDAAFVLQSSGSNLYRARDAIKKGLAFRGPALFSVFSGAVGTASKPAKNRNAPRLSPYLCAALAMDARAVPAFVLDPSAGADWAARFSVEGNPQADVDWPVHRLAFEGENLQRMATDMALTFVDLVAADDRHARKFARVPRSKWHDGMVPVNEFLDLDDRAATDKVPYILMIDDSNGLHRVIVENKVIEAARRCRARWRSLQELAGIKNSHVARVLEAEKRHREEEKAEKAQAPAAAPGRPTPAADAPLAARPAPEAAAPVEKAAAPATAPEQAAEPAAPSDIPYIETARCTSCDECTHINNRMFAYDDNKQAYIANADAGTYRQLVEAAESCQVAIIHPGLPRNPKEPGLEELTERARPFN